MQLDDCYFLGYIVKPIGLEGKFQVKLDVSEPREYTELESVFVELNKQLVPFFISDIELQPKGKAHITFEDIDKELARELKGKQLFLPLELLPELEGNQFYFHEVEGFRCIDTKLGELGEVIRVQESPAQDLLVVEQNGVEILIPILEDTIQNLNRPQREIHVMTPEGLVDMYLDN
jgi:16S rRNA processing protein RimM